MAANEKTTFDWKKPDRVLGDQWSDWPGELDEAESPSSSRTFFVFSALALVLGIALLFFALYMTWPRLAGLYPRLPSVLLWLVSGASALSLLWFLVVCLVVWRGGRWLAWRRGSFYFIRYLFDRSQGLARAFGVHRDRLGHSFVRFSNRLAKAGAGKGKRRLLVLLPRCLRSELRREVEEMGREKKFDVYVATGGGSARQIIYEVRPEAIVAIACERDLVSGIRDVAPRLPVLAVANIRPEGPCKATRVDMGLVREYIGYFVGE